MVKINRWCYQRDHSCTLFKESSSYGDITIGDYSLVKTRKPFNRPLSDASCKSFIYYPQKGWFYGQLSTGQDLDDADSISASSFLYQPSDTFREISVKYLMKIEMVQHKRPA